MKNLLLAFFIFTQFIFLTFQAKANEKTIFSQDCRSIDDDYLKFEIILDNSSEIRPGHHLHIKATAYEDENCQTAYLVFNQYFEAEKIDQRNIDLKTKSTSYQIFSKETAEALNYIQFCNQSKWQPDIEFEVTGLQCGDYQQLKSNQLFYQIFNVIENQMQWGTLNSKQNGRDPSKRPSDFDLIYKSSH